MKRTTIWVCLLLCGCGGGSGDSGGSSSPAPQNASPGGIWKGTIGTGQTILGLVTETGEFHFIASDGVQYFGTASTNANTVSGSFTGYTALGTSFADNSTQGAGTLSGAVQARSTFSASTTFKTSAGSSNTNSLSLSYQSIYDRDSALSTIAGNFRDQLTGAILNINTAGTAFLQNASNGCVVNGSASIIDARFNAYRVQYTYSSCIGSSAMLNGVTFRGLATLDNTASPEQLIIGAQGQSGAIGISETRFLDRT